MSRIGKLPVSVPAGVKVSVTDLTVRVEGPKGQLEQTFLPQVAIEYDAPGKQVLVKRQNDERFSRAAHGLTRALINNMVVGVTTGYEKKLKIEGIGYQARNDKGSIVLTVGYSNPISLKPPAGVTFEVPDPTTIIVRAPISKRSGSLPRRFGRAASPSRTRVRASATTTRPSAARKASPSPAGRARPAAVNPAAHRGGE